MKKLLLIVFSSNFFYCANQSREVLPHEIEYTTSHTESHQTNEWTLKDFYSQNKKLQHLTDSIYIYLNMPERAAQMIMTATGEYEGIGYPYKYVEKLYQDKIIGGVLFLKGSQSGFSRETRNLVKISVEQKLFPLVFSCDCEPTLFHKKIIGVAPVTPADRLTSDKAVEKTAIGISTQMRQIGIHWNFAPVADISTNKAIINTRSFGSDNDKVVARSVSFVRSSANLNIVTSIKHFPGHGAVKGDSHKKLVYIDSSLTEINNFSNIIKKGNPISVMVGHIAIRNNRAYGTSGMPATLSDKVIRKLLIDSLGFRGIIITDAMNMGAVKEIPGADLKAVLAGNDIILYPNNARALHADLVRILRTNGEKSDRLTYSIKKIIRLKICLGLLEKM